MLENISESDLRNLLEAYDNYIHEANQKNQYQYGWRPVSIEVFYKEHFGILNYIRDLEEDDAGSMFCDDFVISHLDIAKLPDFCENCKLFPDDCTGKLSTCILRHLLEQYGRG